MPLRVAVVSRIPLNRFGLCALLRCHDDRAVVADVCENGGHLRGHDAAVYDLSRPSAATGVVGGVDEDLAHTVGCGVPVVGLEPPGRSDVGDSALAAGASLIVGMDVDGDRLVAALEAAANGTVVSCEDRHGQTRALLMASTGLSAREVEILERIAGGAGNQEIARGLYLSVNTIKSHIRVAYKRIGVTSRSQAVLWAVEHDLGPVSLAHRAR